MQSASDFPAINCEKIFIAELLLYISHRVESSLICKASVLSGNVKNENLPKKLS